MLSEQYPGSNQSQALEIQLALQKIIEGQKSLMERMEAGDERASQQIQALRERADRMDRIVEKWETDQQRFIEDTYAQADHLKVTGDRLDKMKAKFSGDFQNAVEQARAEIITENLRFEEALLHMPTETVVSPGVVETGMFNGQQMQQLVPEVVRIKKRVWVLPPGLPVVVPTIVAERLREKRRSEQETAERMKLLRGNPEQPTLINEWNRINQRYSTKTDLMR